MRQTRDESGCTTCCDRPDGDHEDRCISQAAAVAADKDAETVAKETAAAAKRASGPKFGSAAPRPTHTTIVAATIVEESPCGSGQRWSSGDRAASAHPLADAIAER